MSEVREWRVALWRVFFLSDDNLPRQQHSESKQRRNEDQSPRIVYPILVVDLLTRRDLSRQRWPRVNTVPNLAFDLVTCRDLSH